jgi:pimeloyl-ACP methyl ester carboxylesterase
MQVDGSVGSDRFVHKHVDLGDVRLHCAEALPSRVAKSKGGKGTSGVASEPGRAKLVILLHGFPEFWWSWRHQMRALADAGLHVVAPDMRGYNLSDKPSRTKAYRLENLTTDVARLIRAHGAERAHVVGHDWGGGIAWLFAMAYPEMVERLGILNGPHPIDMVRGLRRPDHLKRTWYMFFFQIPGLPERIIARDDFRALRRFLRRDGLTDAEVERYIEALRRDGALRGGISYYRAMMRAFVTRSLPRFRRIEAPVMVVWGERDRYLGKDLARPDPEWVPNARVELLPEAGHWVQRDAPDRVNSLLVDFLRPS